MKSIYIIFFALLFSLPGITQENKTQKPNYKKIKKAITKESSNLNYESLMARFIEGDSTMSLKEKRHLYYGYRYDSNYSPYGGILPDSLRSLMRKKKHSDVELLQIIAFSDTALNDNPFNLDVMSYQLYAYGELGFKSQYSRKYTQIWTIIDALLSSGNGKSQKTAFYVLFISHEYVLLTVLDYQFGGQQSLVDHYDVLKLAKNKDGLEKLYFDVSPSLESMTGMFK
jgi:hypothetical protein